MVGFGVFCIVCSLVFGWMGFEWIGHTDAAWGMLTACLGFAIIGGGVFVLNAALS